MTDAIPDEIMREARRLLQQMPLEIGYDEIVAYALMARPRMPFDEMAFEVLLSMFREHMQAARDGKEEWRKEIFAAIDTFEKMFPSASVLVRERYPVEASDAE